MDQENCWSRKPSLSLSASESRYSDFHTGDAADKFQNLSSSSTNIEEAIITDESPFGSLKEISTRKTFAYLIAILNTTYPDHDFSDLQPTTDNFHKLQSVEHLVTRFNNLMISLGKRQELLGWIWDIINAYMDITTPRQLTTTTVGSVGSRKRSYGNLATLPGNTDYNCEPQCKIYEFQPSDQSLLEDLNYPYQTMWSNYWFIYNKKKKRVCFLYLNAINRIHYSQVNNVPTSMLDQDERDDSDSKAASRSSSDYLDDGEIHTDVIGDMEL